MNNEHLLATTPGPGTTRTPDEPAEAITGYDAGERMAELIDCLDRFVADESSRHHAEEALGLLGRLQTRLSSHICEFTAPSGRIGNRLPNRT